MASTRTYNRSFAGGEMSPEMFGRIDDVKFQTGAALMRNFIATAQGPAENRPGFSFVREVKDSTKRTRLIPFTFSTTQTMVIELGAGYIRFHTQGTTLMSGGSPYEIASPYAEADLFDIHYVQSNDVLTLVHPSYAPRELRRLGLLNWTLTQISFGASLQAPTNVVVTPSSGFALRIASITVANPGVITTASNHGLVPNDSVYISGIQGMTEFAAGFYVVNTKTDNTLTVKSYETGVPVATTGWTAYTPNSGTIQWSPKSSAVVGRYVVTAVAEGGIEESVASAEARAINNLNVTGAYNTVTWSPVSGAVRYNVYKYESGLFGYIGQTDSTSFTDENIAPDLGTTPPIYDTTFTGGTITSVPVTNGGSGYGSSVPAASGGRFALITVTSGGSNYNNPTLTVTDPTGSGAQFTVNTSGTAGSRTITSVTVNNGGGNYSSPTLYLSNTPIRVGTQWRIGSGATFTPLLDPYQPPELLQEVTLSVADPTGVGAVLKPVIAGGVITGVQVISGGYGYTNPVVTVSTALGGIDAAFGTPTLTSPQYPGAVSYFEQRRVFAGTLPQPQALWMTRSGTESDLSYSLPIKDADRIYFSVAAREANTIRHVVPLTQLVLLTSSAEWRVSPVNSDVITPTTISVRPQSYIGASQVQPAIVNNSLVYCAARGGHVRELGYSWQSNGYITGDLSIRSSHLFDEYEISDMCYSKAPQPLLWFVSTSGKLLGLTYIPEQQIGAWHQHDTDGVFESCTAVSEGTEDALYVIVRRTVNGNSVRYVERMATRLFDSLDDAFFVDSGATYNGANTGSTTVTVSGGTNWDSTETLTLTSSAGIFAHPATTDVGDEVVLTAADGQKYRLEVLTVSSTTSATAKVDRTLPADLRATATAQWAWARDSLSGLSHLEGKEVTILAEGGVMARRTVTGGSITLDSPSYLVHVGLPYQCDLQTMPMALNMEGFGQGRKKAVNAAFLRVYRSGAMKVGPDVTRLIEAKFRTTEPYGSPPALKTEEVEVLVTPSWQDSGQVYVRQDNPLPLTVVGMTIEVSIGG